MKSLEEDVRDSLEGAIRLSKMIDAITGDASFEARSGGLRPEPVPRLGSPSACHYRKEASNDR